MFSKSSKLPSVLEHILFNLKLKHVFLENLQEVNTAQATRLELVSESMQHFRFFLYFI